MHVACDGGIVSHLSTDTLTSGVEQGRTAGCCEGEGGTESGTAQLKLLEYIYCFVCSLFGCVWILCYYMY